MLHFENATKSERDFVARCLDQCLIMPKGKKRKILKNFQFHIVKSSFFEVKTYEKLTFFIIFWCKNLWKINFFHHFLRLTRDYAQSCRRVKKENFRKIFKFFIVILTFFDVNNYDKFTFLIIFYDWHKTMLNHAKG